MDYQGQSRSVGQVIWFMRWWSLWTTQRHGPSLVLAPSHSSELRWIESAFGPLKRHLTLSRAVNMQCSYSSSSFLWYINAFLCASVCMQFLLLWNIMYSKFTFQRGKGYDFFFLNSFLFFKNFIYESITSSNAWCVCHFLVLMSECVEWFWLMFAILFHCSNRIFSTGHLRWSVKLKLTSPLQSQPLLWSLDHVLFKWSAPPLIHPPHQG